MMPPVWLLLLFLPKAHVGTPVKRDIEYSIDSVNEYYRQHLKPKQVPVPEEDYMKSPEWNTVRKATLKRDNYACQSCGVTDISLDVHHITYKDFGEEKADQLVSLCRECHDEVHNRLGYDHSDLFPI